MMNVTINMPPSGAEGQQYAANSQPSAGHDCTGGGADRGVEFRPDESGVYQPKPAESEDGMMMQLLTMMMEAIIGLLGGGAEKAEASAEPDPAFPNPNTDLAEGMGGLEAEGVNGGDGAMGGPFMKFQNLVMEMLKNFNGGDDKGGVSAEPDSAFSNPATDSGLGIEGGGAEGVNRGDGALPGPLMQLVNTLMEILKLLLGGDDKDEAGLTQSGDTNYAANYETEAANRARNSDNGDTPAAQDGTTMNNNLDEEAFNAFRVNGDAFNFNGDTNAEQDGISGTDFPISRDPDEYSGVITNAAQSGIDDLSKAEDAFDGLGGDDTNAEQDGILGADFSNAPDPDEYSGVITNATQSGIDDLSKAEDAFDAFVDGLGGDEQTSE